MSLLTTIRTADLTRQRADEVSEASKSLIGGFRVWSCRDFGLFRWKPFLDVPDLHDFLTDEADWDADTWEFEPEGVSRMARTLEWLYPRLPEPFAFSATWGPVTTDEQKIDRADLLAVVERNALATGTLYHVRPV